MVSVTLSSNERTQLFNIMIDRFSITELKDLAFNLSVNHEFFNISTINEFCRGLIEYFERRKRINCLIEEINRCRFDPLIEKWVKLLPPCTPTEKVQLIVKSNLLEDRDKLSQLLTEFFNVAEDEVRIVATASGSAYLLSGFDNQNFNLSEILYRINLTGNSAQITSIVGYKYLDTSYQKAWRNIAQEYPPLISGKALIPTCSWVDQLASVTALGSGSSIQQNSDDYELQIPYMSHPATHEEPTSLNAEGPIPDHVNIDENLIWFRIRRSKRDDFLPEIETDDWVLVRKITKNEHITPNDLVVVYDKTMKSSIRLINTQASEPNAKLRILLGRMVQPPQSFTRDSHGNIQLSHVQISEEQRASVDFEKIVGVVLGFWTSNVNQ